MKAREDRNVPGTKDSIVSGQQALPGGTVSALWKATSLPKPPAGLGRYHWPILTAPDLLAQLAVADQTIQLLRRLLRHHTRARPTASRRCGVTRACLLGYLLLWFLWFLTAKCASLKFFFFK